MRRQSGAPQQGGSSSEHRGYGAGNYLYVLMYVRICKYTTHGGDHTSDLFGSRDLTIFLLDLLSDGDSMYKREELYANLGTPVETCLICTGTPVKTCWKFWQS